ncbi:hypothetical protein ACK3TF_002324 [Chlorella vulgaris]
MAAEYATRLGSSATAAHAPSPSPLPSRTRRPMAAVAATAAVLIAAVCPPACTPNVPLFSCKAILAALGRMSGAASRRLSRNKETGAALMGLIRYGDRDKARAQQQQQLPALQGQRPPSRLQQYSDSRQAGRQSRSRAGAELNNRSKLTKDQAKPRARVDGHVAARRGQGDAKAAAVLSGMPADSQKDPLQQRLAVSQQAAQLRDKLRQGLATPELQDAAASAAAWLGQQVPAPAAELLQQLMAALGTLGQTGASESRSCSSAVGPNAAADTAVGTPAAPAPGAVERVSHLRQQCSSLGQEKAQLAHRNAELIAQVSAQQDQLASLHLRLDNLLLERQRLREDAAEQEAAASRLQAEVEMLRQQLQAQPAPRAQRGGTHARSASATLDSANTDTGGPAHHPSSRLSLHSEGGGSGRSLADMASEEVTWGRTLTSRAPATRPKNVPPVDMARLRLPRHAGNRQGGQGRG